MAKQNKLIIRIARNKMYGILYYSHVFRYNKRQYDVKKYIDIESPRQIKPYIRRTIGPNENDW